MLVIQKKPSLQTFRAQSILRANTFETDEVTEEINNYTRDCNGEVGARAPLDVAVVVVFVIANHTTYSAGTSTYPVKENKNNNN